MLGANIGETQYIENLPGGKWRASKGFDMLGAGLDQRFFVAVLESSIGSLNRVKKPEEKTSQAPNNAL